MQAATQQGRSCSQSALPWLIPGGLRTLSVEHAERAAQAVISGVVYGLGDFTAQTYEQRSFSDFDFARTLRSALCGLLAHGPLSHLYYENLDRFFILSPVREGLCRGSALVWQGRKKRNAWGVSL